MGKYNFDEFNNNDEPTFSLSDFRKWLGKQGKDDTKMEAKEPPVRNEEEEKEAFKEKLKKRRKKKD